MMDPYVAFRDRKRKQSLGEITKQKEHLVINCEKYANEQKTNHHWIQWFLYCLPFVAGILIGASGMHVYKKKRTRFVYNNLNVEGTDLGHLSPRNRTYSANSFEWQSPTTHMLDAVINRPTGAVGSIRRDCEAPNGSSPSQREHSNNGTMRDTLRRRRDSVPPTYEDCVAAL